MTPIVFSDSGFWNAFLPFTFTKPVAELRCGILTFSERWKKLLKSDSVSYLTEDYLQKKFPAPEKTICLFLVPNFLPSDSVLKQIQNLDLGEALIYKDEILAAKLDMAAFSLQNITKMTDVEEDLLFFSKHTDLFSKAEQAINFDFDLITKDRISQTLSPTNGFLGNPEDLFIEEGAQVEFSTLNCKTGKIYIGKNAEVMEGCNLRGPITLGENSKFNLGAKIYGATCIGPNCKVGGEVNNVTFFGYSNKGHDGFLGNSVIGEWCNIGADTNSSNLKNNYAQVKLWDYQKSGFVNTGLQFCGVMMGDHTKTAINTQLNTGTVTGVFANIFKSGFTPNHIRSFSWGGGKEDPKFNFDKAIEIVHRVMERRGMSPDEHEIEILQHLYDNEPA